LGLGWYVAPTGWAGNSAKEGLAQCGEHFRSRLEEMLKREISNLACSSRWWDMTSPGNYLK
jgi:hypothetical protein